MTSGSLNAAVGSIQTHHEVSQFLFLEARLLDTRNWKAWLDLFDPQGMYWAPLTTDQTDPLNHVSLFWENAMLREVRARRLEDPRNWSQQNPTRTARAVSNISARELGESGEGDLEVSSVLHIAEYHKTGSRLLAAQCVHTLTRADDESAFRIKLKRVDLVDAARPFEMLEIFL